ncbi:MAG: glycosyltransferase family 39 protein [Christensenella sp.]
MKAQSELIVWFSVLGIIFLFLIAYLYYGKKYKNPFEQPIETGKLFIIFVIFALLMRLALACSMPGYVTDMDCFKAWANGAYSGGIENFYTSDFFADYPPIYIYVLYFLGFLQNTFGLNISGQEFALLIHIPAIICDIVVAYAVYRIALQKFKPNTALLLSTLILFNPAVIFNSSIWGQIDIILTLMLVLVIWLLVKDRLIWASIAFIVAFLLKPQAIMIFPILAFVFIRKIILSQNRKKALLTLLISVGAMIGLFFLIPLPFGANQEPLWLVKQFLNTMGQYNQATLNAFNIFALLGQNFIPAAQAVFLGIPANVWGFIMIGAVCLYSLYLYVKNPKKEFLFALAAFIIMGVFALGHGMHDRYLFPVPILLLFAFIFMKDKRLIWPVILTSVALLLNQSVSLFYYQTMIPIEWTVSVSAVCMAIFIYTAYVITRLALKPVQEKAEDTYDAAMEMLPKPPAQMRLEGFKEKRTLTKKDGLLMLAITVIYAVVAFTNLGAFEIPDTPFELNKNTVVAEFSHTEQISTIEYYAGYGEAKFEVFSSEDGISYAPVVLENRSGTFSQIDHKFGDMYKWKIYTADIDAKYVKIEPRAGEMPVLEVAFKDKKGNLLTPEKTVPTAAAALFDEQALVPAESTYMTDFYFDEIYHVRTAYENIHGIEPYEITHPPLGKIILASGIQMFGMNPFGWRFMGTFAGVLMLPVLYIFAKLLFKKSKYAAIAAILFAVDFMHFAQTRIGTIDSYSVLWIMLMYLFMYMFTQSNFNRQKISKTLIPLALCGLFFGIGAATKWLCIYAGAGLAVIFAMTLYKRYKEYKFAKKQLNAYENDKFNEAPCDGSFSIAECASIVQKFRVTIALIFCWCVLFFIVVPAIIYVASYYPYTVVTQGEAYKFIVPYDLKEHHSIIGNQYYMLNYHSTLNPDAVHPFASMWYTWPADARPLLFFSEHNDLTGTVSTLSTMGNPLIWWSGVVACIWLIIDSARGKHRNYGVAFTAIAVLSQFMPWWFVTREVFIYHYFATVPFLIILIVYWLKNIESDFKYGKYFTVGFVIACIAMFVFFYPVITGIPFNKEYISALRWLPSWPFYG